MRGVCVDSVNKPAPSIRVRHAGLDSIRVEMRNLPEFYTYVAKLKKIQQAWLVGPSTGPLPPILDSLPSRVQPDLIIIGNEPDLVGESSWTMTPMEYVSYWDGVAYLVWQKWPNVELATAGMVSPDYLQQVYPYLKPAPTYVNRHYPSGIEAIKEFDAVGQRTMVGEWCWRGATEQEMYDWENMLEYYTWHSFWYNWGDWMGPHDMGLRTLGDNPTKAYYYLKKVRKRLGS